MTKWMPRQCGYAVADGKCSLVSSWGMLGRLLQSLAFSPCICLTYHAPCWCKTVFALKWCRIKSKSKREDSIKGPASTTFAFAFMERSLKISLVQKAGSTSAGIYSGCQKRGGTYQSVPQYCLLKAAEHLQYLRLKAFTAPATPKPLGEDAGEWTWKSSVWVWLLSDGRSPTFLF